MTICPLCKTKIQPEARTIIAIYALDGEPIVEDTICKPCADKLRRKVNGETHSTNNKTAHKAHMEQQRQEILQIIQAHPGINSLEITKQTTMSYEAVRLRAKDLERDGLIKGSWKQNRGREWSPICRN